MWLTDLLHTQAAAPAEPAVDNRPVNDPGGPAPPDQAGGWNLVIDLENGRAWYEPLDDDGKDPGKRLYVGWLQ
jgi:hypothetical protein